MILLKPQQLHGAFGFGFGASVDETVLEVKLGVVVDNVALVVVVVDVIVVVLVDDVDEVTSQIANLAVHFPW